MDSIRSCFSSISSSISPPIELSAVNIKTVIVAGVIFAVSSYLAVSCGYNFDIRTFVGIGLLTAISTLFFSTILNRTSKFEKDFVSIDENFPFIKDQIMSEISAEGKRKIDTLESMKIWIDVEYDKKKYSIAHILKPDFATFTEDELSTKLDEIYKSVKESTGSGKVEHFKFKWGTLFKDKDQIFYIAHGNVIRSIESPSFVSLSVPNSEAALNERLGPLPKAEDFFKDVLIKMGLEVTPQIDKDGKFI